MKRKFKDISEMLSSGKINLLIQAGENYQTDCSKVNKNTAFPLENIALDLGYQDWDEFLSHASSCDIESVMDRLFYKRATDMDLELTLKKPYKNRNGFIYMMVNNRNGYTKIGYSKEPKYREKTLQSEEPEIELIWKAKGSFDDELALHQKYKNKRLRGEWFNLSEEDKKDITGEFTNE